MATRVLEASKCTIRLGYCTVNNKTDILQVYTYLRILSQHVVNISVQYQIDSLVNTNLNKYIIILYTSVQCLFVLHSLYYIQCLHRTSSLSTVLFTQLS